MYKVGMWKKLVALSMIVILGVSAVVVASLQTRLTNAGVSGARNNAYISRQVSKDFFENIAQMIDDEIAISQLQRTVNREELERAVELQEYYNLLAASILSGETFDILSKLTQDEMETFAYLLSEFGGQDSQDSQEKDVQSRWFWNTEFRFRLYLHLSQGWFVEGLSSTLISLGLVGIIVKITGMSALKAGVLGLVIGGIVSALIGGIIMDSINRLIGRSGQAGVTWQFVHYSQWWPWNWHININIADFLFELINFGGGRFVAGLMGIRPMGRGAFAWA